MVSGGGDITRVCVCGHAIDLEGVVHERHHQLHRQRPRDVGQRGARHRALLVQCPAFVWGDVCRYTVASAPFRMPVCGGVGRRDDVIAEVAPPSSRGRHHHEDNITTHSPRIGQQEHHIMAGN